MKRLTHICVALLAAALGIFGCAARQSGQDDAGWITLIDGAKGLDNFVRVGTANWTAVDGAVQADQIAKEGAFLLSKNSYRDFVVRTEFWVSNDANSGVFIRCSNPAKINDGTCYEVNIYDQRPEPSYGTAAIVRVAKVDPMPKAGGKWNTMEITAKGTHLVVVFNGQKTVDAEDSEFASGPIGLQWGSGVIKFRKLQIKPL